MSNTCEPLIFEGLSVKKAIRTTLIGIFCFMTLVYTSSCNRALEQSRPASNVRTSPLFLSLKKGKELIFATPVSRQKNASSPTITSDVVNKYKDAVDVADLISNPCQVGNFLIYYTDSSDRVAVAAAKLYYPASNSAPTDSGTLNQFYTYQNDYYAKLKSSGDLADVVEHADASIHNYQLTAQELAICFLFAHHIDSIAPEQVRDMQNLFIQTINESSEVSPEFKTLAKAWIEDAGDSEILIDEKPCGFWCWLRGNGKCAIGANLNLQILKVLCVQQISGPKDCSNEAQCISKLGDASKLPNIDN